MRRSTKMAAVVAAGVVGAGAVATPVVLAADDDPSPSRTGARWVDDDRADERGWGGRMGPRQGEHRYGMRRGMGPGMTGPGGRTDGDCGGRSTGGRFGGGRFTDAPKGTLTSGQEQALAHQAELEKLSHDVYVVFFDKTGDKRFRHIAQSETQHLRAVRALMTRYGVEDPTEGLAGGELAGDAADDYGAYVEDGSESLDAALETAREIERVDIAGLRTASEGLEAPDVEQVYEHLGHASQMHLRAFSW